MFQRTCERQLSSALLHPRWIPLVTMVGGVVIIVGTLLTWFSLFAGLQPYRGVDVLNGRLLLAGGLLSLVAGGSFLLRGRLWLRWGIGLLGFVQVAFGGWSLFQLLLLYRQLSADPMMVAKLGPGHFVVVGGALIIFATFFLNDNRRDAIRSKSVSPIIPENKFHASWVNHDA